MIAFIIVSLLLLFSYLALVYYYGNFNFGKNDSGIRSVHKLKAKSCSVTRKDFSMSDSEDFYNYYDTKHRDNFNLTGYVIKAEFKGKKYYSKPVGMSRADLLLMLKLNEFIYLKIYNNGMYELELSS